MKNVDKTYKNFCSKTYKTYSVVPWKFMKTNLDKKGTLESSRKINVFVENIVHF